MGTATTGKKRRERKSKQARKQESQRVLENGERDGWVGRGREEGN
jgi:DNA-binding protein H-NS